MNKTARKIKSAKCAHPLSATNGEMLSANAELAHASLQQAFVNFHLALAGLKDALDLASVSPLQCREVPMMIIAGAIIDGIEELMQEPYDY
ncbi:MAG: hypothetical protein AB1611_03285 [bacterium]